MQINQIDVATKSIDGSAPTYGACAWWYPYLPGKYLAVVVVKCLSSGRNLISPASWGWWLISVTLATREQVLWIVGGRGSLGGAGYVEPASALSLASTWAPCGSTG